MVHRRTCPKGYSAVYCGVVHFDGTGAHYLQNAKEFSGGLMAGITNYPGLLSNRSVQIDDNQSGLSDKQRAKGTKVGIGVSENRNVMVVIAQNVTMLEFAQCHNLYQMTIYDIF